jgi:hypothetical protein
MWSMLTLVLTINVCFGFCTYVATTGAKVPRIHHVCSRGRHDSDVNPYGDAHPATKETFIDASVNIDMNAGIEHFDKVIPSNFVLSADDIVYKTSLAKERKYNKAVMDGVIEEKRANLRR